MRILITIILLISVTTSMAQRNTLHGNLVDEEGKALVYATAVLLNPEDSTMAYYGITDSNGDFSINDIKNGKYIFQSGFVGYQSYFKVIDIPLADGNHIGIISMQPRLTTLDEVEVNAARIPLLIKNDTVEYIANAFKTKTDGSAEELLKKLPGVEVDRAGNIKAQGESVQRVLVDGKEFFSSDPTVATKNLPANSIDKVQVYNKKSDESELTGIEDGSYSKTINMILKEGQKSAYFGDMTAGYGSDDRYQLGAKLFRFTKTHQFAALGMLNNINKSGFSFQDYLDFQGGLQSLMAGGGGSAHIGLDDDSNMPVDFGQSVNGLVSSGAAGLNFTREVRENNRFNISYLGNGSNKNLLETTNTQNFSEAGSFTQKKEVEQDSKNRIHRLNYTWRNRIDSTQNLNMFGGASLSNGSSVKTSFTESFANDALMNDLYSLSNDKSNGFSLNSRATYLKTGKGSMKLFKVNANFSYSESLSEAEWEDLTRFLPIGEQIFKENFQEDESSTLNYNANTSATFKISKFLYLVPSISAGVSAEYLMRELTLNNAASSIDSLSPDFNSQHLSTRAGISLNRNTQKTQLSFAANIENARLENTLNNELLETENYLYFMPSMSWQYEYSTGKRLSFNYNTSLNAPSARQLLPVANTTNALQLFVGNNKLSPEYRHNVRLGWLFFDQFSATSIFASANATYTRDKIVFSRTIENNLSQQINLINGDNDYRAGGNLDFTTPIKKLGIDINLRFSESWNRGISFVNGVENINTNFSHTISVYFNNRKKEIWDLMLGGRIEISDAKYSIQQSLNNRYVNMSAYSDISVTPNDKWYFSFSADLTRYSEQTFGEAVNIPILRAEISHYFLKSNRGTLTLSAYDLLDKNKGLERISEMNYLLERQTNVLGRYVMLSLKYRLNKFDSGNKGIVVHMRRR